MVGWLYIVVVFVVCVCIISFVSSSFRVLRSCNDDDGVNKNRVEAGTEGTQVLRELETHVAPGTNLQNLLWEYPILFMRRFHLHRYA